MYFGNHFRDYLNDWRKVQKELEAMEQLPPQAYGEMLQKRRKRKKKRGGK